MLFFSLNHLAPGTETLEQWAEIHKIHLNWKYSIICINMKSLWKMYKSFPSNWFACIFSIHLDLTVHTFIAFETFIDFSPESATETELETHV